ncbi:MAG: hypothetical protein M1812_006514, partial [Candelaria pacifica]
DALGVKLGHRRKLQREISNSRGLTHQQISKPTSRLDNLRNGETENASCFERNEEKSAATNKGKRKYRRHPKTLLGETRRLSISGRRKRSRSTSFGLRYLFEQNSRRSKETISKLVLYGNRKVGGENWQILSPSEKEPFETQAAAFKSQYNVQLAKYKQTDNYKEYTQYVTEFKAKNNANQNQDGKRPKLEKEYSQASSESPTLSVASQYDSSAAYPSKLPIGLHKGRSEGSNERASPTGPASDILQPVGHTGIQRLSLFNRSSTEPDDSLTSINRTNSPANTQALNLSNDTQTSNQISSNPSIPSISSLDHERNIYRGRGSPYNPETAFYRSNSYMTHRPSLPVEETSGSTLSTEKSVASNSSSAFQPATPDDDVRRLRSLPLPSNLPYKGPSDVHYGGVQLPQPIQPSIMDPQPPSPYFGYLSSQNSSDLRESSSSSERLLFENRALKLMSVTGVSLPHEQHDLRTRSHERGPLTSRGKEWSSRQAQDTTNPGNQSISPLSVLADVAKDAYELP